MFEENREHPSKRRRRPKTQVLETKTWGTLKTEEEDRRPRFYKSKPGAPKPEEEE
jgi:hypothetical protein